ncbi:MAG: cation:proton antiporter [Planctomycetes bacterium]|nr:cation:proton antiporter [Planctomycetota bacterium]
MRDPFVLVTVMTLSAALLVWLLQRWRLSPIIGYLALGVLVSPFKESMGLEGNGADALANLGVILLMFFIGLEFRLSDARAMLMVCVVGGGLQVLVTAGFSGLLMLPMGVGFVEAAVLGFMVAMSSTALVMKTFEDRREADSQRARVFLTVSLFQDIAAIFVVALLPLCQGFFKSHPDGGATEAAPGGASLVTQLAVLFVGLPILFTMFRFLLPWIFEKAALVRVPEAFSLLSLGGCLSVALAAQFAGASMALGAFLGGLVLAQTPFTTQILADLGTLRNLALGFFFVSVGMLVDLSYVVNHAHWLVLALIIILALKFGVAIVALLAARVPIAIAAGVALPLSQVGEFSFVLAQQADALGMLSERLQKFILALSLLSMLLAPVLAAWSGRFSIYVNAAAQRWGSSKPQAPGRRRSGVPTPPEGVPIQAAPTTATPAAATAPAVSGAAPVVSVLPAEELAALRAVVVGYGPVGKTLTRILQDFGIQPTVVDLNLETIRRLNTLNIAAVYGDAGRREVLEAAGIRQAAYLLVTLPDLPGRLPVVATARLMNSDVRIFTRARYLAERTMLDGAGASGVSFEETEVAVGLARFLLHDIGAQDSEIEREARRIRGEIALRTGFTMVMPQSPRRLPSSAARSGTGGPAAAPPAQADEPEPKEKP